MAYIRFIILSITANMIFLSCISCEQTSAELLPQPNIKSKYSNEEIAIMLKKFDEQGDWKIKETTELQSHIIANFPQSEKRKWETNGQIYEVDFEIGRTDYKAYYDMEGNLFTYEMKIKERDLPAIVKNTALAKYPEHAFSNNKKIKSGSKVYYKVQLKKNKKKIKLELSYDGSIID